MTFREYVDASMMTARPARWPTDDASMAAGVRLAQTAILDRGTPHVCAPPMHDVTVTVPWTPGLSTPCSCPRPLTTSKPSPLCAWHGVDALHQQANPRTATIGRSPDCNEGQSWRCGCGKLWTVAWDDGVRRGGYTAAHAYWRPANLWRRWALRRWDR